MTDADRAEIMRLYAEGLTVWKIGLITSVARRTIEYAVDHNGIRSKFADRKRRPDVLEKNREYNRRWRERRKRA